MASSHMQDGRRAAIRFAPDRRSRRNVGRQADLSTGLRQRERRMAIDFWADRGPWEGPPLAPSDSGGSGWLPGPAWASPASAGSPASPGRLASVFDIPPMAMADTAPAELPADPVAGRSPAAAPFPPSGSAFDPSLAGNAGLRPAPRTAADGALPAMPAGGDDPVADIPGWGAGAAMAGAGDASAPGGGGGGFVLPVTAAGAVANQADIAMRADIARASYGVDGTGLRIGVLSDSYDHLGGAAADIASGDLPANGVTVLDDVSAYAGTDEGRAMLQLIHDVAPGAQLLFHSAMGGEVSYAQGIVELANAGADIIVDDYLYLAEPMFQDGRVAQAVDEVVGRGVAYFSAASNLGRAGYESEFRPSGQWTSLGQWHDFDAGPGVDTTQSVEVPLNATVAIILQWDEPFRSSTSGGSRSDIDIHVLDQHGNPTPWAGTVDNLRGDPIESIVFTNTSGSTHLQIAIAYQSGPVPGQLRYIASSADFVPTQYTGGATIYGHAAAAGAMAVGAASYARTPAYGVAPAQVEDYSAVGMSTILFDATGQRLAVPEYRLTPGFTAPDDSNTTFFGRDTDGDGRPNFQGTSAAAPHAAAVAALMLQANPYLTPTQIYDVLKATALDMDDPGTAGFDTGWDRATGFGLIQADAAVAAALVTGRIYAGNPQANLVSGGSYDDSLSGLGGSDTLHGNGGADTLDGGSGVDRLNGGDGNDFLAGMSDADLLYGDPGADRIYGNGGRDTLFGGTGNDVMNGGSGSDLIEGEDGADTLYGLWDLDTFLVAGAAGHGFDSLSSDTLRGGAGDDSVLGGTGSDWLEGGDGRDFLAGLTGADTLYGNADSDTLYGNAGADTLFGGVGGDSLNGGTGADGLEGGDGNDTLVGLWDLDTYILADALDGGFDSESSDTLLGGNGDDVLTGSSGADLLHGGEGADVLYGLWGNDILLGGAGDDQLYGNPGIDLLYGDDGADWLDGGGGTDLLDGGAGNDTLVGMWDSDTLYGSAGADSFISFGAAFGSHLIADYSMAEGDSLAFQGEDRNVSAVLGATWVELRDSQGSLLFTLEGVTDPAGLTILL